MSSSGELTRRVCGRHDDLRKESSWKVKVLLARSQINWSRRNEGGANGSLRAGSAYKEWLEGWAECRSRDRARNRILVSGVIVVCRIRCGRSAG